MKAVPLKERLSEAVPLEPAPAVRKGLAASKGITASALMGMKFDPIRYVVPGYVAEGLTLFAGSPKIGKSWAAMGLAIAVSAGGLALGSIKCDQGDVLYLALEYNLRRLQSRLRIMQRQVAPQRLTLITEWPALDDGCLDELEAWAQEAENPRLIIVDVLAKIRPPAKGNDQLYDADYRTMTGLHAFATRHRLAVLVVHHTRKMEAEDPFDQVSGTRGLTGAADTVMVLKRDIGTAKTVLYVRGRDVEEIETALEFKRDIGTWIILGAAHEVGKTNERQAILNVLAGSEQPLTAVEVSDLLGKSNAAIRQALTRMWKAGEIEKEKRGRYTCHNRHIVPNEGQSRAQSDVVTHVTGDILKGDDLDVDGNIIGWNDR